MRLRSTALPCFFVTVYPTRGGSSGAFRSRTSRRKARPRRTSPFRTARNCRAAFKPPDSFLVVRLVRHRPDVSGISALGRETLAATCAASGKNLAAAIGGHAGAEAVTTLANKLGRLVGTLHFFNTAVCGPSLNCFLTRQERFGKTNCTGGFMRASPPRAERGRLIRGLVRKSQSKLAP